MISDHREPKLILEFDLAGKLFAEEEEEEEAVVSLKDVTDRVRMEGKVRHRNKAVSTLYTITAAVNRSLNLGTVLDIALRETLAALNMEGGAIFLFDEADRIFTPIVHCGMSQEVLGEMTGVKTGEGLSGWVAESGTPRIVDDLGADLSTIAPSAAREGWKAYAGVPITCQDKVLGVMSLITHEAGRFASPADIDLLTHIGAQIGVAIRSAQLYREAKQAAEKLRGSLREKEVLLREIHHRVKNNLQIISSLLNLQSQYVEDTQTLEMLKESRNRIKAMALVHEALYQSEHLAEVDMAHYIRKLVVQVFRSYRLPSNAVRLRWDMEPVFLSIDRAIPCGLIINELVSNSLKHAFPPGREGEIRVALRPNNDHVVSLMVGDNGVGIPEEVDALNTKSLGVPLVYLLTQQLKGTVELDRTGGTAFKITFQAQRRG